MSESTTYRVNPIDVVPDDDPERCWQQCPGCLTAIDWGDTPHSHGGMEMSYTGACTCGEWTRSTDRQNRPGEGPHYHYTPAPWGQRREA